jgi:hypothetical protein
MTVMNATAKRFTTTGACGVGRARLATIHVVASGAARLTIAEGAAGPTKLDIDFGAAGTFTVDMPGDGIIFSQDPRIATLTAITSVNLIFI